MRAGRVDRRARIEPVVDDADDRLQQRAADPVGPGAADDELHLVVAQDDGGGHHRRHPPAGRGRVEAQRAEVLLAHDVVDVDARARDHDARALPVRAGHRRGAPLAVHDGDVRRPAEPRGQEALEEAGLGEALDELVGARLLGGRHRVHDVGGARRAAACGRAGPARGRGGSPLRTAAGS